MKKLILVFAMFVIGVVSLANSASAATAGLSISAAYPKPGSTYDVVVKEKPGDKLALYVNDANPVYATVNKKGWATFRQASLSSTSKLSFTHVYGTTASQKPISFVRYVTLSDQKVSFAATNPAAKAAAPAAAKTTPVATPAPVSTPPPAQPICSSGSYINSAGNRVCSPEAAPSAPAGATAQCVDGTYSFSQSRSGTCSHHGGVGSWL
jgi:hypothetical protein